MAEKVEHISESDFLNDGREKINKFAIDPALQAEKNSNNALNVANNSNETANDAKDIAKNTDGRLNNIIAGEMDDAEVIDARKPFGGDSFPTLGNRLDNQIGKNNEFREFEADKSFMARANNEFFERGYNVKSFGATGDGVTDDTEALKLVEALVNIKGGAIIFPTGTYLTNDPLVFSHPGTLIRGMSANWGGGQAHGSVLKASENFIGESIVTFRREGDVIRSVGVSNIAIDGGENSNAHGLTIDTGYDFCLFENVMVQNINAAKHAWNVIAGDGKTSQTHTYINCIGKHRDNSAFASTCYFEKLQEAVMINFKSWSGFSTTFESGAAPFELVESTGITFYNPSAVGTTGAGFILDCKKAGKGSNIQLINPLFEQVKQPVKFVSKAAKLWGEISAPPEVGTLVKQGTASGVVSFASGEGIYVYDVLGVFSAGGINNESGTEIGTIQTVDNQKNEFIKIINPKTMGDAAAPFIWKLENIKNCEIEIDNKSFPAFTINATETAVESALKLAMPQNLILARDDLKIDVLGYTKTAIADASNTGIMYISKAIPGMEILGINNRNTRVIYQPATGDTFEGFEKIELAPGTRVNFRCLKLGTWVLSDISGSLIKIKDGERKEILTTVKQTELAFTSSQQIGLDHINRVITNKGATGYVAFNLSKTETFPGAQLFFVKDANQTLDIVPNSTDRFRGKSLGEKITITEIGKSLTILNTTPGVWDII